MEAGNGVQNGLAQGLPEEIWRCRAHSCSKQEHSGRKQGSRWVSTDCLAEKSMGNMEFAIIVQTRTWKSSVKGCLN